MFFELSFFFYLCRGLLLKVLSLWGSQMDVPEQELLALALEGNANAEEGVVALCGGPVVVGKVLGSFWEKESYHVIVKVNFFFFFFLFFSFFLHTIEWT